MVCILKIDDLTVTYGNKIALDNISLEINSGDFIALLGSNGAGKSTFINSILGLQEIKSGIILYNSEMLSNKKQLFSCIGFTPQTSVMDYYTTVWDNVILGLYLAGKKGKEAEYLCQQALSIVGLLEKRNHLVESLSGGQLQRVQIARAIAHKPDIYILDEPTVGLDAESSERFLSYLRSESEKGKTIIISSHDIQLLESYCSKILFLKNGKINFWGNISDFIDNDSYVVEITFNTKLSEEDINWLEKYEIPIKIVDSLICILFVPKSKSLVEIIQDLSTLPEIKDISLKDKHLRDIYLEHVNDEVNND
ncbi:metal ABC transporter ATP-binding protein [Streptococcus plurextorum]|uniref:metal ABC transporter ATP-binding protein n=1 Tax=Streptococcus plurextorum TaxID=456876 RepID=UPI000406276E|nr:ABC transporter ATP-binding protein [Streptococcus plurextorum]